MNESVDKEAMSRVHDYLNSYFQEIHDLYGIRVEHVSVEWATMIGGSSKLIRTEMHTSRNT